MFAKFYRNIFNKSLKIHTIGDSHAKIPWINVSIENTDIIIHHLGPRLMYTVGKKPWLTSIKNFNVSKKDIIIYCFGEIDCRCHIWNHKDLGYKNVIKSLVNKYIQSIIHSTKTINNRKVFIQSIVPAIKRKDHLHNEISELPFLGKDETRKSYVMYMNETLKKSCEQNHFNFFNVYDFYTDGKGFLDCELSDKNVHIGDPIHIENYIKNNIIPMFDI